jgi:hypothetical protein
MTRSVCVVVLALVLVLVLGACRPNPVYVGTYDAGDVACNRNSDCAAVGGTCCNHTCTNLDDDPANCGACGTACQACQQGTCVLGPDLAAHDLGDLGTDSCAAHGGTCAPGGQCPQGPGGYSAYSCGSGDLVCCPPGSVTECRAHGGQCLTAPQCATSSYGSYSCAGDSPGPAAFYCCPPGGLPDGGLRHCPCQESSDCDPGSFCVGGLCVSGGVLSCGEETQACCGGWCGSCAAADSQCINGVCQGGL